MNRRVFPDPEQQHLLKTVRLELIEPDELARWNELIEQHHYLHNAVLVGEVLRYVARDEQGRWIALLGYSSASLHLRVRDEWLGWSAEQRERRLRLITQNSRFLILPGVDCPNLASRLLKLGRQSLARDFPRVHGHPVVLVETFVDPRLYRGACYQAAAWQALGRTAGWARAGKDYYQKHEHPKELWVQPLDSRAREWLRAERLPAALSCGERVPPPRNRLPLKALSSLINVFARLPDARRRAGTRHRLDTVLACAALGVLAGGRTLADLAAICGELPQTQLRALRAWQHPRTGRREAPSETTFQRTLSRVDAAQLDRLLGAWLGEADAPLQHIAIDGKALRGTDGLHLFSAFAVARESVVAQLAIPAKTNEIPMVAQLLADLPLEGTLVSADALHTQADTARHLVQERGADYLFTVKNNQPALREACERLLSGSSFPPYAQRM
jgi:Domain of unknown function (DUF4338)/DDE_Tnp_1-associated/Transposase DDE domain